MTARAWRTLFLCASALLLVAAVVFPQHGDYGAFRAIWSAVLKGSNPWFGRPLNAYGPLFNALAPLTLIHARVPRLLFAATYVALVAWLAVVVARRGNPDRVLWRAAVFAVMNPFAWIELTYWGNFDVLVALTCVAAIDARLRQRDVPLGGWLAGGILLKFFPVVLAPVLLLDRSGVRRRAVAVCALLLAVGFALSVALWGSATFRPLTFAASRPSLDSVFSFLRGPISPLHLVSARPNVDWLSTPVLALAGLVVFVWCVRYPVEPSRAGLMAVLAGLLFYRTGLTRYQMVLFAVLAYWLLTDPGRRPPWLRAWLIVYIGWVQFCDLAGCIDAITYNSQVQPYALVRGMRLVAGRGWGLVTFSMGLTLLVWLMADARRPAVRTQPV